LPFESSFNNFDMIYASWMTPGLFLGGGQDIAALSHEMSETYGDPFIRNDVTSLTTNGMTYHPQTEALLQWFESNGTSDAINGAFSYPDETILTTANISQGVRFDANGNPTCTGPLF
jgi:hypothetical protein